MAKESRQAPGAPAGALIGFFLTCPLIALFYLAWKLFGLPFVPFNIFDWVSRVLPGPVLSFGIGSMVQVIRALHFKDTAVAAKTAEQSMGILGCLAVGVLAAAVLFALLRFRPGLSACRAGLWMGAGLGAVSVLISHGVTRSFGVDAVLGALWILAAFLGWGAACGWVYTRLQTRKGDRHVADSEPVPFSAEIERVDRRHFIIRLGGAMAVITVVGAEVGTLIGNRYRRELARAIAPAGQPPLPNANAEVKPAPGTRPEITPLEAHYRIDIDAFPPTVNEANWRLKIGGLVEQPLELKLEDIRRYKPMDQYITLSCISNPVGGDLIGTTRWTGVSLQHLLPDWKLSRGATHLKITSADGYYEIVSLETIHGDERVMLAYAWDGVPLLTRHGFPLRIYIPDRYGMKQPKWIESIEAMDHDEDGYWVTRGWDKEARMKATTVIDTTATDLMIAHADPDAPVPLGGISHAGARGISKVEVQVDGGGWREALLRKPLSGLTWVLWRYDWPFEKGRHTFKVRCFDGAGTPQIAWDAPPDPSGAAGIFSETVTL